MHANVAGRPRSLSCVRVEPTELFLITGAVAAGKSTVAQLLAERFPRSVHLRGDAFRKMIVAGREDMSADPSPEALAQLRLRYELLAHAADRYVAAGFTTVAQDVILGPLLADVVALFATPPTVIVLAPSVATLEQREAGRPKVGYGDITPASLDAALREDTPRLGMWIDSSEQTPTETVDEILRRHRDAGGS